MTLLQPRFDYTPIKRSSENGKRVYTTPTGDKVPSVTTILSATTPKKKKEALENWRKNVGHHRAQQITTQAANRGTRLHTYLEDYVKTGVLKEKGSNPFGWASHSMADTVIQKGLSKVNEVWGVEIPLYIPKLYAGTADGAGIHLGEQAILDYKQTNKPKKDEWIDDYKLQLCAYAHAHNELFGTNIKKGVVLMAVKPNTDSDGLLVLNEDDEHPKYQEFVVEGTDFDLWSDKWWSRLEQFYLMKSRGEI